MASGLFTKSLSETLKFGVVGDEVDVGVSSYVWVITSKSAVQSHTIPMKPSYVLGSCITRGKVSAKIGLLPITALLLAGLQLLYVLLSGLHQRSLFSQGSSSSFLICVLMF